MFLSIISFKFDTFINGYTRSTGADFGRLKVYLRDLLNYFSN